MTRMERGVVHYDPCAPKQLLYNGYVVVAKSEERAKL